MAARKDKDLQELEVIFKSLAIRINRSRPIFKNQDFSVSHANILNASTACLNTFFEAFCKTVFNSHTIKLQPYGSRAEDFNDRQDIEDFGDSDFMILPTAKTLMVHGEMIEYLPDNLLHVRIKGVDHPMLQSCLVEDTEYVATSALKNFHPAIYGVLGPFFSCMDQWMAQNRMFSFPNLPFISVHSVKNSMTSPAITIAVVVALAKASAFLERYVKESTETDSQIERNIEGQPVLDTLSTCIWNASYKEDENIPGELRIKQLFKRFCGNLSRILRTVTAEEMVMSYDFVPALTSSGWPKVAQEWIKRKRKWPSPSMVDKVIQEGFHLVAKPPKNGGYPDRDFRISFSHAEFLLSQEMNDIQRDCYICLKQYHRAYLSALSDGLTTFHLKNIYLQTIEETGAEMWREGNRAECMMKLLGNLLEALRKKDLRHFFVRSYNLFCTDYIEDPEILELMAGTVEQIMENPLKFSKDMLQNQHLEDPWPWQLETDESVLSRTFTPFAKLGTEGQEHEEIEESLATQRELDMMSSANQPENNSFTSHTADDLKELFSATMKELTDMASNDDDDSLEALDPLERSLVEEFRDIRRMLTSPEGFDDDDDDSFEAHDPLERWFVEEFGDIPTIASLKGLSEIICRSFSSHHLLLLMAQRPEPNMRCRVLAVIQGAVKVIKYVLQQVESDDPPGGALDIVLRFLDPAAEEPFDWYHLITPFYVCGLPALFKCFIELLENFLPKPAQLQELDMDDIPLD